MICMNDMTTDVLLAYAVKMRRALHSMPELSGEEYHTSAFIRRELEGMGYTVRSVHTGLIADTDGGSEDDGIIALRADFDALPITERTGLPFAAACGRMHACGHDGHTAMLLAAFLLLGWENMQEVALQSVYINCVLFVINMIPIPPLDGSRFLKYAVDMSEHTYYAISRYGILILLLLVNIPFTASIFMFITRAIASVFIYAALLVVKLFS